MNEEQRIVYMRAQILCTEIEFEAMKTFNRERESNGLSAAYDEQAFLDLINRSLIGHNACVTELEGH